MHWYGFFISIGIFFVYFINILYFKYKKIFIDLNDLLLYIYPSAFLGGKLIYFFFDFDGFFTINFGFDLLYGGFSLLGASFFALTGLLYYVKKNNIYNVLNPFLPISLLLLHSLGRVGCYCAQCCGGILYNIDLHAITIFFYLIATILGLFLYRFSCLISFLAGIYYYVIVIFLERFLFDPYRYDVIIINKFFTKYQLFSICYLVICFLFLFVFYKKVK